jgi:hypothetical protein
VAIDFGFSASGTKTNQSGTERIQKVLSQEAIDKLIYDVLSSDNGIAQLAAGENLSGGSSSSTKTLQTQDFLTKVIGELANVTAETIKLSDSSTSENKKSGGAKTVICTELHRQGKLDTELYEAGTPHWNVLNHTVWRGYICWAEHVVPLMKKSEALSNLLLPVVRSRYQMIATGKFHFLGALTLYVGQPICYLIGLVMSLGDNYGRKSQSNS